MASTPLKKPMSEPAKQKITPRTLRFWMSRGEWTAVGDFRKVEPPREWTPWKRERMQVAMYTAELFLNHGMNYADIVAKIGGKGGMLYKRKVTRQRVSQLVIKGTAYLLSLGMYQPVRDGEAA